MQAYWFRVQLGISQFSSLYSSMMLSRIEFNLNNQNRNDTASSCLPLIFLALNAGGEVILHKSKYYQTFLRTTRWKMLLIFPEKCSKRIRNMRCNPHMYEWHIWSVCSTNKSIQQAFYHKLNFNEITLRVNVDLWFQCFTKYTSQSWAVKLSVTK